MPRLRLVEICRQGLDAAGTGDQVRFIPQHLEGFESAGRLSRQLVVQDDAVAPWKVGNASLELVELVNRDLGAVGQLSVQDIAGFSRGELARVLPGEALGIAAADTGPVGPLEPFRRSVDASAMDHDDDMRAPRCGDHAFLGVRGEPGVPDDVVVGRVRTGMQQLRH